MNTTTEAEVAARLERLRKELASQASQIRRGAAITLFFGLLCVAGLSVYFYWGYSLFSEVLQNDRVADTVATIVDDNVPVVRKSLEEEARKSAPSWAEGLSKQLRDSLPTGRKKLEDYVIDQTRTTLAKGTVLTEDQFTKFLQTNRDALRKDVADLAKKPELAESAIGELEKSLQGQLDSDFKANANDLVYILTAFSDKLTKLAKNQNLDQTEGLERRLAMIVRRVQSEKVAGADIVAKTSIPPCPSRPPPRLQTATSAIRSRSRPRSNRRRRRPRRLARLLEF